MASLILAVRSAVRLATTECGVIAICNRRAASGMSPVNQSCRRCSITRAGNDLRAADEIMPLPPAEPEIFRSGKIAQPPVSKSFDSFSSLL